MTPGRAPGAGQGARPRRRVPSVVPWVVLAAALILATLPAWRPLVFGTVLTLDDLLSVRCLSG